MRKDKSSDIVRWWDSRAIVVLRNEGSEFDNEKSQTERGNGRRVTIGGVTIVLILIQLQEKG